MRSGTLRHRRKIIDSKKCPALVRLRFFASCRRNVPDAALRGFANGASFSAINRGCFFKGSARQKNFAANFKFGWQRLPCIFCYFFIPKQRSLFFCCFSSLALPSTTRKGIERIVRTFVVTSSPSTPSPRVTPRASNPFS